LAEPEALILREQFRTPVQQRETATIGMWIFLATEVMLFGGLFLAFTVYRMDNPKAFIAGSADMNIVLGAINTAVLIGSSFTMALAVYSAEIGRRKLLNLFLACTMVLGAVFLAIKFTEYYLHYLDHRLPGPGFLPRSGSFARGDVLPSVLHHDRAPRPAHVSRRGSFVLHDPA